MADTPHQIEQDVGAALECASRQHAADVRIDRMHALLDLADHRVGSQTFGRCSRSEWPGQCPATVVNRASQPEHEQHGLVAHLAQFGRQHQATLGCPAQAGQDGNVCLPSASNVMGGASEAFPANARQRRRLIVNRDVNS